MQYERCRTQAPPAGAHMPNPIFHDDAMTRSIGRIAVIRAQLASRPWPLLADLSQSDRDVVLDGMALRDYRSEHNAQLIVRT